MFLKTYTWSLCLLGTKFVISHTFYYSGPQRKPLFKLNERSGNKTSQVHLNSTATTFRDIAVAIYLALCNER